MSYIVLARKYRSKDFDDLVGQGPIAQTLKNAIETNRVAHAYLFCGTRGVGKTSTARILAKALNCEKGPTTKPCNVCDRCKAISAGEDIDVIEIDGASNNGVDAVRDLRNNAIYRPARSPFKIYIIDEVHMLSTGAFNALLKTLEEPPSHVKFIFATTETSKVPQTIASRCQQFQFRPIPTPEIAGQLEKILKLEKIKADESVVQRVARAGRGSMRDALSLMDQLLAMGADKVTEAQVEYLLGEPAGDQVIALVNALADNDPAAALNRVDQLLAGGASPEQFVLSLIEHLRRLMLLGVVGADCPYVEVAASERDALIGQSKRFDAMTLIYMIEVLEQLRQAVRLSTTAARALMDATVVRLALLDRFADTAELLDRLEGNAGSSEGGGADAAKKKPYSRPVNGAELPASRPSSLGAMPVTAVSSQACRSDQRQPNSEDMAANGAAMPPAAAGVDLGPPIATSDTPLDGLPCDELWQKLLARMNLPGMAPLTGPLRLARLVGIAGGRLKIAAQPAIARLLSDPRRQEQLCSLFGKLLDRPIDLEWVDAAQPESAGESPAGPANNLGAGRPTDAESVSINGEAASANGPTTRPAGSPAALTGAERTAVLSDPTVRRIMDVFNASVVGVDKGPGK